MFSASLRSIKSGFRKYLYSPAYPIVFSVYSVLALYAHNIHGIAPGNLVRPLAATIIMPVIIFWIFKIMTKRSLPSSLLTILILFFFYYYGHIRNLLYSNGLYPGVAILASLWLGFAVILFFVVLYFSHAWSSAAINPVLNLVAIILILFPLIRMSIYYIAMSVPLDRNVPESIVLEADAPMPDVYYIILDGYTRGDVMKTNYGYDNSGFIQELNEMGFFVAECSQANYGFTSLSISSALNLDYIQELSDVFQPGETDLLPTFKLLDSNLVRNSLAEAGYRTVAFESGFYWIEWRDADFYLSPPLQPVSEFEIVILLSTYARLLDDFDIMDFDDLHAEHYRERTRYILQSPDEISGIASPKFVFVHIIAPHEPFAFDKHGNPISPEDVNGIDGYAGQAEFISKSILPYLKRIIEESQTPPVIILQGDHGRLGDSPEDLMRILNAYYLPEDAKTMLYPSISPVNSFRIVFNSIFDTEYPLLDDVSYYSSLSSRYNFSVIPNECQNEY